MIWYCNSTSRSPVHCFVAVGGASTGVLFCGADDWAKPPGDTAEAKSKQEKGNREQHLSRNIGRKICEEGTRFQSLRPKPVPLPRPRLFPVLAVGAPKSLDVGRTGASFEDN